MAGIIFLAMFLRLLALVKYGDFWDDEMFNYIYSQKPWPDGLFYWLWETNPPLHLLILKIWFFIVPATEFFARLPGVIIGTITVPALYYFGKNLFDKNTAILAAFYLAIHPYHIFWSATARVYIFLMFLVVCSSFYFFKIYINEERNKKNILYQKIITLFLLMSHLSALFFLAGQTIIIFITKGFQVVKQWGKDNLIPLIFGGGWIILAILIKINNNLANSWFLNIKHSFKSAVNPFFNLIAGQINIWFGVLLLIFFFGTVMYYFANKINNKEKKYQFGILIFLFFCPIFFSLMFGVWHIKFFISILPLFVLIFAGALNNLFKQKIFSLIIITIICFVGLINLFNTLPLSNWKSINNFIENQIENKKNDSIFIYNNYILKTQIDRYLTGINIPAIPLILYEQMEWDDMVVKKNYLFIQLNEEEKNNWYKNNKLDNYKKIILLEGEYDYMNKLKNTFIKNGWVITGEQKTANIAGAYYLYVFERDN
jgi:uncharacterized membrane protein